MSDPTDRGVDVPILDDRVLELTRAGVLAAASQAGDSTAGDPFVTIDGRHVPALPLVARALHTPEELLRPTQALAALRELEFTIRTHPAGDGAVEEQADLADDDDSVSDITPELARTLQRARGSWVAVHRGRLLSTDLDLTALLHRIQSQPSTVLFVPKSGLIDTTPES